MRSIAAHAGIMTRIIHNNQHHFQIIRNGIYVVDGAITESSLKRLEEDSRFGLLFEVRGRMHRKSSKLYSNKWEQTNTLKILVPKSFGSIVWRGCQPQNLGDEVIQLQVGESWNERFTRAPGE